MAQKKAGPLNVGPASSHGAETHCPGSRLQLAPQCSVDACPPRVVSNLGSQSLFTETSISRNAPPVVSVANNQRHETLYPKLGLIMQPV